MEKQAESMSPLLPNQSLTCLATSFFYLEEKSKLKGRANLRHFGWKERIVVSTDKLPVLFLVTPMIHGPNRVSFSFI